MDHWAQWGLGSCGHLPSRLGLSRNGEHFFEVLDLLNLCVFCGADGGIFAIRGIALKRMYYKVSFRHRNEWIAKKEEKILQMHAIFVQ